MRRVLLVACFLAACARPTRDSRGGDTPAESVGRGEAAAAAALSFEWTPPCKVPVTERLEERGEELEISFVMRVAPSKSDGAVEVHFDDVKVLSANGVAVPSEERRLAAVGIAAPAEK